ncbi:MAG: hypothetical protein Q9164_005034 [Protoblastenia rupestris]
MCRHGLSGNFWSERDISLDLESSNPRATSYQSKLLEGLSPIGHSDNVTVFTANSRNWRVQEVDSVIGTPYRNIDEILKRASSYQVRAQQQFDKGDHRASGCIAYEALKLLNSTNTGWYQDQKDKEIKEGKLTAFSNQAVHFTFHIVIISLALGDVALVRAAISKLAYCVGEFDSIANIFDRVTESQGATAYQYLGSAWMAEGVNSKAAWCFLEALRRSPVHKSIDIAIDQLEAQVKASTDLKDLIVRYNIVKVLQPLHHCAADRNIHLSADEHHHI